MRLALGGLLRTAFLFIWFFSVGKLHAELSVLERFFFARTELVGDSVGESRATSSDSVCDGVAFCIPTGSDTVQVCALPTPYFTSLSGPVGDEHGIIR